MNGIDEPKHTAAPESQLVEDLETTVRNQQAQLRTMQRRMKMIDPTVAQRRIAELERRCRQMDDERGTADGDRVSQLTADLASARQVEEELTTALDEMGDQVQRLQEQVTRAMELSREAERASETHKKERSELEQRLQRLEKELDLEGKHVVAERRRAEAALREVGNLRNSLLSLEQERASSTSQSQAASWLRSTLHAAAKDAERRGEVLREQVTQKQVQRDQLQNEVDRRIEEIADLRKTMGETRMHLKAAERETKRLKNKILLGVDVGGGGGEDSEPAAAMDTNEGGAENESLIRDLRLQVNMLKDKVMCSLCNRNERTHIVAKCFHTFCEQCISERVDSRMRRCPSCNLGFAKSDVHRMYL
eukprot:GABV01000558.1.p1 GENE.GABV01000558.1~~GABV01000558.1.p1  ORF type:complete len:364 (+),score=176.21 GABV01000558.1:97-1188(+)